MSEYFKYRNALVESTTICKVTRIWAFAHVFPGAGIGKDCNVCDGVFIKNGDLLPDTFLTVQRPSFERLQGEYSRI